MTAVTGKILTTGQTVSTVCPTPLECEHRFIFDRGFCVCTNCGEIDPSRTMFSEDISETKDREYKTRTVSLSRKRGNENLARSLRTNFYSKRLNILNSSVTKLSNKINEIYVLLQTANELDRFKSEIILCIGQICDRIYAKSKRINTNHSAYISAKWIEISVGRKITMPEVKLNKLTLKKYAKTLEQFNTKLYYAILCGVRLINRNKHVELVKNINKYVRIIIPNVKPLIDYTKSKQTSIFDFISGGR